MMIINNKNKYLKGFVDGVREILKEEGLLDYDDMEVEKSEPKNSIQKRLDAIE